MKQAANFEFRETNLNIAYHSKFSEILSHFTPSAFSLLMPALDYFTFSSG